MMPALLLPGGVPPAPLEGLGRGVAVALPDANFEDLLPSRGEEGGTKTATTDAAEADSMGRDDAAIVSAVFTAARPGVADSERRTVDASGVLISAAPEDSGDDSEETGSFKRQRNGVGTGSPIRTSEQGIPSPATTDRGVREERSPTRMPYGTPRAPERRDVPEDAILDEGENARAQRPFHAQERSHVSQDPVGKMVMASVAIPRAPSGVPGNFPTDHSLDAELEAAGKIDRAIPAEKGREHSVKNDVHIRAIAAEAHGYRDSGWGAPAGTLDAKRSAEMKFAPPELVEGPDANAVRKDPARVHVDSVVRREGGAIDGFTLGRNPISEIAKPINQEALSAPPPMESAGAGPGPAGAAPAPDRGAIHAALRVLHTEIVRSAANPGGDAGLDLELPMDDGEPVRVRLNVGGGEVRAIIRTESAELRTAFEQAWPQLAQRCQDRGIALGEARFQSMEPRDFGEGNADSRRPAPEWARDESDPRPRKAPRSVSSASIVAPQHPLSLWA